MNNLQLFLAETPVDNLTETINLGGRLSDFPFTIKAMTGEDYTSYQTLSIENPNSNKKRKLNTKKFNELIVVNGTVDPCFKDAEFIKKLGVADGAGAMYKTLLAGEISMLSEEILRLSGFDRDTQQENMEEVKN